MKFKNSEQKARYFRAALRIAGITAKDFSKRYGVSRTTIYNIIHGIRRNPTINREINTFIEEQIQNAQHFVSKLTPE